MRQARVNLWCMGRKSKASADFFQPGAPAGNDAAEEMSIPEAAAAGAAGMALRRTGRSLHRCQGSVVKQEAAGVLLSRLSKKVVMLPAWALQGALLRPRQLCRYCRAPCRCQARSTTPRCERLLMTHWHLHKFLSRTHCGTRLSSEQSCSKSDKRAQITFSYNPYLTGGIGAATGEPLPVASQACHLLRPLAAIHRNQSI